MSEKTNIEVELPKKVGEGGGLTKKGVSIFEGWLIPQCTLRLTHDTLPWQCPT